MWTLKLVLSVGLKWKRKLGIAHVGNIPISYMLGVAETKPWTVVSRPQEDPQGDHGAKR